MEMEKKIKVSPDDDRLFGKKNSRQSGDLIEPRRRDPRVERKRWGRTAPSSAGTRAKRNARVNDINYFATVIALLTILNPGPAITFWYDFFIFILSSYFAGKSCRFTRRKHSADAGSFVRQIIGAYYIVLLF